MVLKRLKLAGVPRELSAFWMLDNQHGLGVISRSLGQRMIIGQSELDCRARNRVDRDWCSTDIPQQPLEHRIVIPDLGCGDVEYVSDDSGTVDNRCHHAANQGCKDGNREDRGKYCIHGAKDCSRCWRG
jgi:hypothetical protein